jgi:hypothetical protein
MSSKNVLDYFFAPTRIASDEYETAAKNVANTSALTRQVGSVDAGCSATLNPAAAMADQPGLIPTSGYGSAGGCKINENTELRWGIPGAWRQKGPKQLWARPFATTPNLGGGDQTAVEDESTLIHSALIRNRKEANSIMDKPIPNYYQPLIAIKSAEYSNPANWVESWTRGGDATRLVDTKRVGAN